MAHVRVERTYGGIALGAVSVSEMVKSGTMGGLAGGALMAAWLMVQAAVTGYGPLFFLNLVGATFRGADALVGGAGVMLSGLLLHIVVSVVTGILFAVTVTRKTPLAASVLGGMAYALVILVFMNYVVMPYANPIMRQREVNMPAAWFLSHLMFGVGLGLVPLFKRGLAGERLWMSRP